MNRHILYIVLMMVFLSLTFPKAAFGDVSADEQNSDVSITITKFQVNDQTLELTYKIKNDSDHDIWICDSVNIKSNRYDFEAYVAKDGQTLVIRKRFDLPGGNVVLESDFTGRYVRLRPGQERADSLLVTLPPTTNQYFDAEIGRAKYTSRLALEIGYYDEDLRSLILNTVEVADKLGCDTSTLTHEYHQIYNRYFPGLLLALEFNHRLSSQFRDSVNSQGDEILMPPMSWGGIHLGEKVLRLTVDGVYIRCLGEPPLSETLPADVTMALTGFDVNDTNLELNYQIRNDTEQDIWICKDIDVFGGPGSYEVYTTIDGQTLVMRRRLEALEGYWYIPPQSKYARLRPDENRIESLSFTLPIEYLYEYPGDEGYATRLVVEVGYYPVDLPGMIREILDVAEKMNWQRLYQIQYSHEIVEKYFTGLRIAQWFGGSLPDVDNEIGISWMGETRLGEQALQFTIDGVRIPHKSP